MTPERPLASIAIPSSFVGCFLLSGVHVPHVTVDRRDRARSKRLAHLDETRCARAATCFLRVRRGTRKGNCWDNAVAESFFATLKRSWSGIASSRRATRDAARSNVFEYIEAFYNRRRAHSLLCDETPTSYRSLRDQVGKRVVPNKLSGGSDQLQSRAFSLAALSANAFPS